MYTEGVPSLTKDIKSPADVTLHESFREDVLCKARCIGFSFWKGLGHHYQREEKVKNETKEKKLL